MNAAKVRKDLSLLGSFGTRGSGYDPGFLIAQIDRALGVDENWSVAIVGIGNLGRALTNSAGFASRGCRSRPSSTSIPTVVGEEIRGIKVRHMDELATLRAGRASRHRRHHDAGLGRPGRGRPARAGRGDLAAQLRPACAARAAGGAPALRRPVDRAAGPRLLPGPPGGATRPARGPTGTTGARSCAPSGSRRVPTWTEPARGDRPPPADWQAVGWDRHNCEPTQEGTECPSSS